MALRPFRGTEIRSHLGRLHHYLPQQQHAGAYDFAGQTQHSCQRMYLGQIPAGGAQLLPDIRNRVQPDDVHSPVGQIQHVLRHIVEHRRVCVIEVPLIGIEVRHDNPAVLQLGKAPRRSGGEHLGHRLFELPGNIPAVVEEIPLPISRRSGSGLSGPLMVLAGVIHDEIQTHQHPALPAGICQRLQIFHRPQLRLHRAEIGDGIPAVAAALGTFQQGHQMEVVDPALLQIRKTLLHTPQIPRERVHIQHHTQHVPAAEPVGMFLPPEVLLPQDPFTLLPTTPEHSREISVSVCIAAVEFQIERLQLILAGRQPAVKGSCRLFHKDSPRRIIFPNQYTVQPAQSQGRPFGNTAPQAASLGFRQ